MPFHIQKKGNMECVMLCDDECIKSQEICSTNSFEIAKYLKAHFKSMVQKDLRSLIGELEDTS